MLWGFMGYCVGLYTLDAKNTIGIVLLLEHIIYVSVKEDVYIDR